MKISVDDQELFTVSDLQKKVIQSQIPEELFEEDMKRRLRWVILEQKYFECLKDLRREWYPRLKDLGVKAIPTDDDEFAKLIFSLPEYKSRSTKIAEQKAADQASFKVS